jgi:membrane protein YqaA with SNARE-associated domain
LAAGLNAWKQKIVAFAGGLGAPGLFLISFLDSSVLTFPVINDLLLVELSIQHPARMPLYAFLAMLGSVLGCVLLFFIAEKGGEALFHKHAGKRAQAIHNWVVQNGFGGMLIAALLPPPTPFKVFVVAAGGAAGELCFGDNAGAGDTVLWNRIPVDSLWKRRSAVPGAAQAASDLSGDCCCSGELCAIASDSAPPAASGRARLAGNPRILWGMKGNPLQSA